MTRALAAVALTLLLAACRSQPDPHPELQRVDDAPAPLVDPADPFESPAPPAPEDDIPESERIEFHRRHAAPPPRRQTSLDAGRGSPVPGDARDAARFPWGPPLGSSRGYTYTDCDRPFDSVRRQQEEVWGPGWNRFGWYDW